MVLAPKPRPQPDPTIGYDQPLANARYRYEKRLSADGTVPENAWMRAKGVRDRLIGRRQYRAGVSPNAWTFQGPTNVGGRIRPIVIHPTTPTTMWIGSTSGGIWKTTNGGTSWAPLDDFLAGITVSTLILDRTNPNVLYAGTGEGFFETEEGTTNTACIRGAGIFKSTDGGTNWVQIPATANPDFYFVNRIAQSPTSANTLIAACSTGIWRSTNGGVTWTKTLANEWVYDVDYHPTDGNILVAGTHANGVFRSTNGGLTWTRSVSITGHRTEIAYAASSPTTVYATVGNGGSIRVWRSTDGGVTFTQRAGGGISTYEAYNNTLWVSPTNSNLIIYGGVYLYRSSDGGASRSQVFTSVHADMHGFATHPQYDGSTNKTIYIATDGGIYRCTDTLGGNSAITFLSGLGITQFYGASINPVSGRIFGGTQDNGTRLFTGNIANWTQSAGGDGGYTATDPADANYFYGTIYWALHFRSTNGGSSTSYIYNTANPIADADNEAMVNFENYLALDPNNSNRMLVCARRLWRSNNVKAASPDWFIIKPDIAPPGNRRPGPGGGNAHFATNNPYNISTVAVAPGNSNVIWVGHNNGEIYVTTNGTATSPTWTRVDTTAPLPDRWVSRIAVDPTNPNHAYAAFLGWHDDSIWETTDGGNSWTDIASGKLIPASVNVIALHPTKPGWIYAGTDLGLFTTSNGGGSWTTVTDGPGMVPVEDISFRNPSLIMLATYGRGIWTAPVDVNLDKFGPDSLTLTWGIPQSGGLGQIQRSDDTYYVVRGNRERPSGLWPTEVSVNGHSPIQNPAVLTLVVESKYLVSATQRVQLFDHVASGWVTVNTRVLSTTDTTATVNVTSNPSRFVGTGGLVNMRIGIIAETNAAQMIGSIDLVEGRVAP